MIPLKWMAMLMAVGTLLTPVISEVPSTCTWLTPSESGCVKDVVCDDLGGDVISIWEDCPDAGELFTITNSSITLQPDCKYATGNPVVNLIKQLNAEVDENRFCDRTDKRLFFIPVNINEFSPYPTNGISPTEEVDIPENKKPGLVKDIYYTDDDLGETEGLTCTQISPDYGDIFSLTPVDGVDGTNIKTFRFSVEKELNFEEQVFYKMEYDIISTDGKDNIKSVKQTFFVSVTDEPDEKPFFSQIKPVYSLDECMEEDYLFSVTAQDRDVMVNYAIRYTMLQAPKDGYFKIDNTTGAVSKIAKIDREDLLKINISSFSLNITATEYKPNGHEGEQPNSEYQVTIITIQDCNNKEPMFECTSYEITMDELPEDSNDQDLDLKIVVTDMDEGIKGSFHMSTSDPTNLAITPEGRQKMDVTLTAICKSNGNNHFNYEEYQDNPLTFNITATEDEDPSHTNTVSVTITLRDVNDNSPIFNTKPYKQNVKENEPKCNELLKENEPKCNELLKVSAVDADINDDFGSESIRYSLDSNCYQLGIDNTTGSVTLATDLDYDDPSTDNEIHCDVKARDSFGNGLLDTSEIIITVIDVVDEPPEFAENGITMIIQEGSAEETVVNTFIVNDKDDNADVTFTKVSSVCTGGESTLTDVDGWFTVVPDTPNPPEHRAIVKVSGDIDRETCSEVTLDIMANDVATIEDRPNVNGTVTITITDKKDEAPIFKGDYADLEIHEFDENDLPENSQPVFVVTVSDPDEGDTINLAISQGAEMLELSKTQVIVEPDGEVEVTVKTKKNAVIDRETQDTIEVEITLTNDDERGPSTSKKFSIRVIDLNDKTPIIDKDLCEKYIHVTENKDNSSVVYTITATDADATSPYNEVTYVMLNDQMPDSKYLRTPFTINKITGEVSVYETDTKFLDRETDDEWELLFRAYDNCDQTDLTCTVQTSNPPCKVTVIVDDVNDNAPEDLTVEPNEVITVDDFLQKDYDLGYLLYAHDRDMGENASLSYKITGTYGPDSDDEKDLFYAVDMNVTGVTSCRLYSKQDFKGMNLTGLYIVTLKAEDGGGKKTDFNITVIVKDGNDHPPLFRFEGCAGEDDPTTIRMEEGAYLPGVNGNPTAMEVKCSSPDGMAFNIHVEDSDIDLENRKRKVKIDKVNSTIVNAENEEEQLDYWTLEPEECTSVCHLKLSHEIDREKGTPYNLVLHAKNDAEPLQESWTTVRVVITNRKEFSPYFCPERNCSQVVSMVENDPGISIEIREAIDLDNTNISPGDVEYDKVFYFIKGGDSHYFQMISDDKRTLILKNKPDGLDREKTQNYSLIIVATNDPSGGDDSIIDPSTNDTLHLLINVDDVNDLQPTFTHDVIFTSFMQTNSDGDTLTTIKAEDGDLIENLTYTILDDLQWFDTDFIPTKSFKIERKDLRSAELQLDFNPKSMTQGYANFTLRVTDAVNHMDETEVKVYIINDEYKVAMYFSNTLQDVQEKQVQIQDAYSEAYSSENNDYECVIDSITSTQIDTREGPSNETTVYMHFIDIEKNEPVAKKKILDLSDNAEVMNDLQRKLEIIDIHLNSVDKYIPPVNDKNPEDTILTLQILLGVVSLVMGAMLVLLVTVYCIRTRSLTRKVKVLSTNTFGSKESGLNHIDMGAVPGSNLAKIHGNQNPVFNENGAMEFRNHDTGSISSGDSVLVGVEDNPEFKNYSAKGDIHTSSQGYENPTFGRSIDEVSAPPPGVQGGMKGNPLLNLDSLQDTPEPSTSTLDHTTARSHGSESDAASFDQRMNSNFTFS